MQENNFEKQVQQKAGELKITPSDEVWQKLVVAIAQRKSNRRAWVIVLLLLIFTGSVVFLIWNHSQGVGADQLVSANDQLQNHPASKAINAANTKPVATTGIKPKGGKDSAGSVIITSGNVSPAKTTDGQQNNVHIPLKPETTNSAAFVSNDSNNGTVSNNSPNSLSKGPAKNKFKTKGKLNITITNSDPSNVENENSATVGNDSAMVKDPPVAANTNPAKERIASTASAGDSAEIIKPKKDPVIAIKKVDGDKSVAKKTTQQKQKTKWKVGVNFSPGITGTQNSYLGIGSGEKSMTTSFPSQATGGTGAPATAYSSGMNAGIGFIAGVFVQKNISSKTSILLGINFSAFNTHMMTGARIDSVAGTGATYNLNDNNAYYRSGYENRYKNHFYFIELPLTMQINLHSPQKAPVLLSTGISIARLMSTNALQFDTQTGIYYNKNALISKTRLSISAGLLFSLSGRAANPLVAGPEINFSLNKIANTGIYENRYYNYFGIRFQKSISKK